MQRRAIFIVVFLVFETKNLRSDVSESVGDDVKCAGMAIKLVH